jgi:putative hydrolase of the HAD superfamily
VAIVRAILFDFGGTLDQPVHWLDRFLQHYRASGMDIDREQLDGAFDYATKAAYQAAETIREWGLGETVCYLVGRQLEHLLQRAPEPARKGLANMGEGGRGRLRDRIAASFCEEASDGMAHSREVLQQLKPRFRLGVVSNFYGNLDRVLDEAGMLELMDVTIDSSRVGVFKPDPRIFAKALQALGDSLEPAETAMVGDSPSKDCAPARRAGLTTVLLCGAAHEDDGGDDSADYKIHALEELLRVPWL